MSTIVVLAEQLGGTPARIGLELIAIARTLAAPTGATVTAIVAGEGAAAAAPGLAAGGADVLVAEAGDRPVAAALVDAALPFLREGTATIVLAGTTPDGRDAAGALVGLLDLPVAVASTGVAPAAGGAIEVRSAPWGGRVLATSELAASPAIILVRPGSATPAAAATPGTIASAATGAPAIPAVRVSARVASRGSETPLEEARIVIGAGRGVGGPDGVTVLRELADALGGTVGATRAVVDSGWIDFDRQIGQTGRTVRPDLYVAAGISGAIQHKVGVQAAGTIVAINRDADAPIAEFADVLVVGDLFEVVPALTAAIRERRTR